ncbi:protein NLP2-like isoform X2 [Quercus suber]|uniref:protein NLP2-like isoform X2 n=1 Tax=Quercus suber TaxID=58331 RepID=UPI0032DEC9D7
MENGFSAPGTILGALPNSAMELALFDELFQDRCWLEAAEGLEFLLQSPSSSGSVLGPSFVWPALEARDNLSLNSSQTGNLDEAQRPLPDESQERSLVNAVSLGQNTVDVVAGCSNESENIVIKGPKLGRRSQIAPNMNQGLTYCLEERLMKAIEYIREFTRGKDVLIQVWLPVNRDGRRVLTTSNQPFAFGSSNPSLASYRDISADFHFAAEEDSKEVLGLPGRVFLGKVPEWTPDVQFFTKNEYFRVVHAQLYDVRGTLALPIFEHGSSNCVGVIEVVMTAQQTQYGPEIESVCKALEAVDLRSFDALSTENLKACPKSYQAALPEIQEVLRFACKTHRLPLAQTWVPCIQQGKVGCRHSNENYIYCVSTVDRACIVADPNMQEFHEACSEHHLLKGEGIVGEAFKTNQPRFSSDITSLSKTEYPLSHHARLFGLHAAVAIHLRSIHTGTDDFVLEFFLPTDCRDPEEQKNVLNSLSHIIQQVCQSLQVVTDKELEEDTNLPECSMHGEGNFPSVGKAKAGEKRHTKAEKTIPLEVLQQYFAGSLKDASKSIGVCPTTLKRICRQHGINRWPSRKIKKVGHSIKKLQLVIDSVEGASGALQIDSFYTKFPKLASPNLSGTNPFSASKLSDHPQPILLPEGGIFSPQTAASKSSYSSCSQSSSSTHAPTRNVVCCKDPIVGENFSDSALQRITSEAELHASSQAPKLQPKLESLKSFNEHPSAENFPPLQKLKVTYGDEKIRLRMKNNWGYKDLLLEIACRFNIDDISRFDVKYLDDDSEWVLLTCDDDLEECIDICRSSQSDTIKLALQVSRHRVGRSLGSNATS